jgi:hypothetical protein
MFHETCLPYEEWAPNTWKVSYIQAQQCDEKVSYLKVQQCDKKVSYLKVQQYNKNPCAVYEKLRRDNFKFTQCSKQRQGNLQYTEKATGKSYLKTITTMQEYPDDFVVQ